MKKWLSRVGGWMLAGVLTLVVVILGAVVFFSDNIANYVLANAVSPELGDHEPPPTAYAITSTGDDQQILGGQGMGLGCSLEPWMDALAFERAEGSAPVSLQMRQACAFHDFCYRHGNATYNYTQADCDFLLQEHAFRLCMFINTDNSVDRCETDARKVTLGVRVAGSGNFLHADELESKRSPSTFFEFDPYPVRSAGYVVARLADAPASWRAAGVSPKAAYVFRMRPSGAELSIIAWTSNDEPVCTRFELGGRFSGLNVAPLVARDGADGEEWFVWWRRERLGEPDGRLALLPVATATLDDWKTIAGGVVERPGPGCSSLPPSLPERGSVRAGRRAIPAFVAPAMSELDFSELHVVPGGDAKRDGILELMALSPHSCGKDSRGLPCFTKLDVDLGAGNIQVHREPPDELPCGGKTQPDCDRYRNFVSAPVVVVDGDRSYLLWLRRGGPDGAGYETTTDFRLHNWKSGTDGAADLATQTVSGFTEAFEPVAVLARGLHTPSLMSLMPAGESIAVHRIALPGKATESIDATCLSGIDTNWLQRPPVVLRDGERRDQYHLVFSRVQHTVRNFESFMADDTGVTARLHLRAALLDGPTCRLAPEGAADQEGFDLEPLMHAHVEALKGRTTGWKDGYVGRRAKQAYGELIRVARGSQLLVSAPSHGGMSQVVVINAERSPASLFIHGRKSSEGFLQFYRAADPLPRGPRQQPPASTPSPPTAGGSSPSHPAR
jgi:hypothetical protein